MFDQVDRSSQAQHLKPTSPRSEGVLDVLGLDTRIGREPKPDGVSRRDFQAADCSERPEVGVRLAVGSGHADHPLFRCLAQIGAKNRYT